MLVYVTHTLLNVTRNSQLSLARLSILNIIVSLVYEHKHYTYVKIESSGITEVQNILNV